VGGGRAEVTALRSLMAVALVLVAGCGGKRGGPADSARTGERETERPDSSWRTYQSPHWHFAMRYPPAMGELRFEGPNGDSCSAEGVSRGGTEEYAGTGGPDTTSFTVTFDRGPVDSIASEYGFTRDSTGAWLFSSEGAATAESWHEGERTVFEGSGLTKVLRDMDGTKVMVHEDLTRAMAVVRRSRGCSLVLVVDLVGSADAWPGAGVLRTLRR
jgi:hypothetical protein